MRQAKETFVHFIHDNLVPLGIPVHYLRRDPNDRTADALQDGAVNVAFYNLTAGNGTVLCSQQAVIDVVHCDENTATDWVAAVLVILREAFFTPLYDYTVPTLPVAMGTNLTWDRKRTTFKRVASATASHYSCLLSLRFSLQ